MFNVPEEANPVPTTSYSTYFITVGGCTQVTVFQRSGLAQYYVALSWNGYYSDAFGETSEAALQEAIANFEAKNPPCLAGSTTGPAPATSNPVLTTSYSTYFITVGGCTQVTVFQRSGLAQYYVALSWNGYYSDAFGETSEAALQEAIANFEAKNPPCLAGSTTGPAPATSNPVPTTSYSTYFVTVGGCTQVTVFQRSGLAQYYVALSWNGYYSDAFGETSEAALQEAIANFEAKNPPCLSVTTQPA